MEFVIGAIVGGAVGLSIGLLVGANNPARVKDTAAEVKDRAKSKLE